MKSIILTLALLVAGGYTFARWSAQPFDGPVNYWEAALKWKDTSLHQFGTLVMGVPVSHTFEFTNEGSSELLISQVKASCGCTVTDYSSEPIPPGGTGYVQATYDASKPGKFSKTIHVSANIPEGQVVLTIAGEVVAE
jgi:hypothetical protein